MKVHFTIVILDVMKKYTNLKLVCGGLNSNLIYNFHRYCYLTTYTVVFKIVKILL